MCEEELNEGIEKLKQNIKNQSDELHMLHQLDSLRFLKNLASEKEYILKIINFKIQEITVKETISYEKLKNALYDINTVWFESYHNNKRSDIKHNSNLTKLLLTSFMMIRKKVNRY